MDDFQGIPQTSLRGGSGCGAFSFRNERRGWVGKALDAGVLDMLRNRKEPCFDDQCAKPAADLLLPEPDMLGDRRAESAAADDDHVERPASSRRPGIDLRDVIAEVAAFHVLRERRSFCKLRHVPLLLVRSTMVGRASLTISRFYLGRLRLPNSANCRPFYLRVCAFGHIYWYHFLHVTSVYRMNGSA